MYYFREDKTRRNDKTHVRSSKLVKDQQQAGYA